MAVISQRPSQPRAGNPHPLSEFLWCSRSNPHHHNGIPLPSTTSTNHRDDTFSSPGFQIGSEETAHIGDGTSLLNEGNNIEDEERNGLEIAAAAIGQPQRVGQVPFYTGNQDNWGSSQDRAIDEANLPCRRKHRAHLHLGYLLIKSVLVKTLSHSVRHIKISA